MAASFTVVAQQRTILVRSPTRVEDVQEIHAVTHPHSVTFVRYVPITAWKAKGAAALIAPIAERIEGLFHRWPILSAGAVQDVDGNGLITNGVEFVVHAGKAKSGDPEAHTATVTVPVQELVGEHDLGHLFAPVIEALQHVAEL